jgi:hypothetical protein
MLLVPKTHRLLVALPASDHKVTRFRHPDRETNGFAAVGQLPERGPLAAALGASSLRHFIQDEI